MRRRSSALTVAGSDPSGGAGLELDLQVMATRGVPGAAVATCLTDQDSRGVHRIRPLSVTEGLARLETVLADQQIPAAKIGMLPSAAWVRGLAASGLCRGRRILVLDPVRGPTSGPASLGEAGRRALVRWLLPRVTLLTPNLPEAAWLLEWREARVHSAPEECLQALQELGAQNVLLKGGHAGRGAALVDRLRGPWGEHDFRGARHPGPPVRGTGCALTACLVAELIRGLPPAEAVRQGVRFVREAIRRASRRGRGRPELGLPDP